MSGLDTSVFNLPSKDMLSLLALRMLVHSDLLFRLTSSMSPFINTNSDGPGALDFIQGDNSSTIQYVFASVNDQAQNHGFAKGTCFGNS